MKLLLVADMEGITGVTSWDEVTPGQSEWQRFRRLMTDDVNAAISGLFDAGAEEVIVKDGHWNSNNLLVEQLDSRAILQRGTPAPLAMLEGIQAGVDAVLFIGAHARVGTQNAILDHTWSSNVVNDVFLNGLPVGEIGLNAALCGELNIPAIMVSGDLAVTQEAQELIPGIHCAVVKEAKGRYSAACYSPTVTIPLIRKTAAKALDDFKLNRQPKPFQLTQPVKINLSLRNTVMGDRVQGLPGVTRVNGREVLIETETMLAAYQLFRAVVALAG